MMKIGDTIKCQDMADMWSTRNKLLELGIYADPAYPLKKFTLKVWKIEEDDNDHDRELTDEP